MKTPPKGQILYREDPDDGDGTHKPSLAVAFKSSCGRQSPPREEPRCAGGDYLQMCASRKDVSLPEMQLKQALGGVESALAVMGQSSGTVRRAGNFIKP